MGRAITERLGSVIDLRSLTGGWSGMGTGGYFGQLRQFLRPGFKMLTRRQCRQARPPRKTGPGPAPSGGFVADQVLMLGPVPAPSSVQ